MRSVSKATRWVFTPGSAHRQPFSSVASSSANQKPRHVDGSVYRNVESWWQLTSPPMWGCLKMYMDWSSNGRVRPSSEASPASSGVREKRSKSGSRSCNAWPILLMDSVLSWRSEPSGRKAFSSKKKRMLSPEERKYSSEVRV